jgi:quercetin dioxygenase-like cupin family protein
MAKTMLKTKQVPKPTPGKKTPAASRAPRKSARGGGSQRFVVSHPNEADFKAGLRAYAKYRDLGISQATGGLAQAHVIRFVPPFRAEEVSQLHYHDVEFQMIYVLKGWIRSEFEGQGAHTMHAGACWIQPPRIEHKVLGYSDDCEVLEIILPAEFETVMLD